MNKILLTGLLFFVFFLGFIFTVFPSVAETQSSTWTVQTLKEYFDQRFESLATAITKQENAYNDRFNNTNEWRSSYDDIVKQMQLLIQTMQRDYVPRTEYLALERQLNEQKARMDKFENLKVGGSNTLFIIIAIISFLAAVLAFSKNFISSIYRKTKET